MAGVNEDELPVDNVISSRLWWNAGGMGYWWRLVYLGKDENCNWVFSVRVPFGTVNLTLNVPLRQKPCTRCQDAEAWEAFKYARRMGNTL